MTRIISEILNVPHPEFFFQIEELERLSGRSGLDIKLSNELQLIGREKIRYFGLDESDTAARELYFAVVRQALGDSRIIAEKIGVADDDSPRKMIEKSIRFVEKRLGKKHVWSLKPSVSRRQLKNNPPKKLMKIFGIRSMDSALKRDRISVFYCFAGFVEPPAWTTKHAAQARTLTSSDFDSQPIKISILPEARRSQLFKTGLKLNQIIFSDQESAGIEICVPPKRFNGDVLFVVDSLLSRIKKMITQSAYYKARGLETDFFSKLEKIRSGGFLSIEAESHPFDWHSLMHAATELGVNRLIYGHDPFVSAEELLVPGLPRLAGLEFWKHPFGLYADGDILISFNLSDMIINAINELPPERGHVGNARSSLKNELFGRYLHSEPLLQKVMNPNPREGSV